MSFLSNLKTREQVLLVLTIIVLVWGAWSLIGGMAPEESKWSIAQQDVDLLESEYIDQVERIGDAPGTLREYIRLIGTDKEEVEGVPEDRPDLLLQEQLAEWSAEFNMGSPQFEKDIEDIEDIDDYQMVAVTITIRDADMPRISALLKRAERRGLIIQELSLSSRLDSPSMDCTARLARIVPRFTNLPRIS